MKDTFVVGRRRAPLSAGNAGRNAILRRIGNPIKSYAILYCRARTPRGCSAFGYELFIRRAAPCCVRVCVCACNVRDVAVFGKPPEISDLSLDLV